MRIRKARETDILSILDLARRLDLDYPGMEGDGFWVAVDSGKIVGIVGLKKHADVSELCALGVDPKLRGKGIAKALVEALCAEASGDVHLGTVIPAFFETCGFSIIRDIPKAFVEKRASVWCEGCDVRSCCIMMRKKT